MLNSVKLLALVVFFLIQYASAAYAQGGCAKDNLGRVVCAPAGGVAVNSLQGVACAPGQCVTDSLGYLKCSSEKSGGASKDILGNPVCVGGCISPSKAYCAKLEEKK